MSKRMLQMLGIVVLFLAAIGFVKFRQIQGAIAAGKSFQMPPETVTTIVARDDRWPSTVDAVGSVAAVHGVTLSADLPGVVAAIEFESGAHVAEGQVLVKLDSRQELAEVESATAQRDLAKANLDRADRLMEQKLMAPSDHQSVKAQFDQAQAALHALQATLDRKLIRAPFAGVTGIRTVNVGQYVRSGDPIVPLQSLSPLYVNFAVPQQQVGVLRPGDVVKVTADRGLEVTGRINAVNPVVDDATRNVAVQATVPNPREALRPGMYVSVSVETGAKRDVIALPVSAVNYAPYGNSVFVVETSNDKDGKPHSTVRQQFVKLGATRGDLVAVTEGVKVGEEVVTSGVFKLRSGAAVQVNNSVTPSASPNPHPANS
jgi:membrane fusion protein (multidrug efflux system)